MVFLQELAFQVVVVVVVVFVVFVVFANGIYYGFLQVF